MRGMINRMNANTKRKLSMGRYAAWFTYLTAAGGFEPADRTVVHSRPCFLRSLTVFTKTGSAAGFLHIFDCADATAFVEGNAWNPTFIRPLVVGGNDVFTPPRERAGFEQMSGTVLYEDEAGFPFDHGLLIVVSPNDDSILAPGQGPANEIRITARILDPQAMCQ